MKTQNLMIALLFVLSPMAAMGVQGQAEPVTDCFPGAPDDPTPAPENGECANVALPGGEGDCAVAGDPLWVHLCTLATTAGFALEPSADADDDGRADYATRTEEVPGSVADDPSPLEDFGRCANDDPLVDDGDVFFGHIVCETPTLVTVYFQLDVFFGDFPAADASSATVPFLMVADPSSGEMIHLPFRGQATVSAAGVLITGPGHTIDDQGLFPDGQGFRMDHVRIAAGDPRSNDMDDDGDSDFVEVLVCGSNPLNGDADCADLDGDGLEGQGGDSEPYTPFDPDLDDDGVLNAADNCPTTANPDQANNDGDAQGDACDADDDNDGTPDSDDALPFDPTETGDNDGDGIGNNADADDDNDGHGDGADNCPTDENADQRDLDDDGLGDACDDDRDGDEVPDEPSSIAGPLAFDNDCDPEDPAVGAPTTASCATDDAVAPVLELLEGDPPSPTGVPAQVLNAFLYPDQCTPEPPAEPEAFCAADPFDTRDERDTDGNGVTTEPNGQTDLIENRVYYTTSRTDAALDLHIVTPRPSLAAPPPDALQVMIGDPDTGDDVTVFAIVGYAASTPLGGLSDFYCLHAVDHDIPLALGHGASIEDACADRISAAHEANGVLAETAGINALFGLEGPIAQFIDVDADSIPEGLSLLVADPSSCTPVGAPPEVSLACGALIDEVIPLGGLPSPPEGTPGPCDVDGSLPVCEPEPCDPETDPNGCQEPEPCDPESDPGCEPGCEGTEVPELGECVPDPTAVPQEIIDMLCAAGLPLPVCESEPCDPETEDCGECDPTTDPTCAVPEPCDPTSDPECNPAGGAIPPCSGAEGEVFVCLGKPGNNPTLLQNLGVLGWPGLVIHIMGAEFYL